MKRTGIACLISSMFGMGCAVGAPDGDEAIRVAEEAFVAPNAIFPNAIFPNAIFPNAIFPNALSVGALSFSSLAQTSKDAFTDPGPAGDLSRMFLKYAVSCAFTPNQSFTFSWIDSNELVHNETYVGDVGLAYQWQTGSLGTDEQKWVSACLAARTNYYGVSVLISMRGLNSALATTTPEIAQYAKLEGAFWGNIFQSSPELHACYFETNYDHSISSQRICATGLNDGSTTTNCGIIALEGDCDAGETPLCTRGLHDEDPYSQCDGNDLVITTFLQ